MSHDHPPCARLRLRREFGGVMRRQQKAAGRNLVILIAPQRRDLPTRRPRLGIMVSRKVSKSSPRRHQLKRWVRELFRCELQHAMPAVDMIVLFRRDLPRAGHAQLDHELRCLLPQALAAKATWHSRGKRR